MKALHFFLFFYKRTPSQTGGSRKEAKACYNETQIHEFENSPLGLWPSRFFAAASIGEAEIPAAPTSPSCAPVIQWEVLLP